MKNIFKSSIKTGALLAGLLAVSSCEKYLEIPDPIDAVSTESAFTSKNVIDQLMNRVYDIFINSYAIGEVRWTEASSDNGFNPTASGFYLSMQTNTWTAADFSSPIGWINVYKAIFLANTMLEGLPGADAVGFTEDEQNEYMAACYTIRAACYYNLVRCWGEVPLVISTDVDETKFLGQSPAAEIYTQIEADLQQAISLLPADKGEPYFINCKYIPQAYLADVYLTQGKWADAEAAASAVINSGNYQLDDSLNGVFLQGSLGTIFATGYTSDYYGEASRTADPGGYLILPPPSGYYATFGENSFIAVSPDLQASFEPGDMRKEKWITIRNTGGYPDSTARMWPYKYKYNYRLGGLEKPPPGWEDNQKEWRIAEVYLIRAEARARQNNLSGAAEDMDLIRNRAGLANTTAATQDDMIDAVLHERRVEFFFEKGIRWFDLVRTGQADAVLSQISYKTGWKPYMVRFPVPKDELDKNPNLTQNEGW